MKFIWCLSFVLAASGIRAQDSVHLNFRPARKTNTLVIKKTVLVVRTERFKFTATTKPTNKFVSNSSISLNGLSYDVRMKFYVSKQLSLVLKTKNPSANSRDFASFGIILKMGQWKK